MKNLSVSVFVAVVVIWGGFALYSGYTMSSDSATYARWADTLIGHHFNLIAYSKNINLPITPLIYLGFVFCVAVAKVIAGPHWQQAIVLMNVMMGALVGSLIADMVYGFIKSKWCAWAVVLLFVFNVEISLWSRYILSDISFMFISFLTFYLVVKTLRARHELKIRYWVCTALALFLNGIWRPVGMILVPIVLLSFYLSVRNKEISWGRVAAALAVFIPASILLHAFVVRNVWAPEPSNNIFKDFMVDTYHRGIIIDARPHTYHQVPQSLLDYALITADRFAHYFYFFERDFSLAHNAANALMFVPLYTLFLLGILSCFRGQTAGLQKTVAGLSVLVIIAYALFHAMIQIDYDWRYRLPALPYMLFVAGFGLKFFAEICKRKLPFLRSRGIHL